MNIILEDELFRFIPVDTGNTVELPGNPIKLPVHPRGYGEHSKSNLSNLPKNGSSPWIRGTHPDIKYIIMISRFIPVDTGNTLNILATSTQDVVHPRGYGEHS